jgi:hypothetical protein
MEMEFFVPPADGPKWYEYWCKARLDWYIELGIPAEMLRIRAHDADELSHYSAGTSDVEFLFPWGWGELEGIAQRTDFDLTQHSKASGQKLDFFDQATNERYIPYVVEPAAGANRTMAAFLLAAYDEDIVNDEPRTVLRLHPRLAPYKVAVLPLSKKDTLSPLAVRSTELCPSVICVITTKRRPLVVVIVAKMKSERPCVSRWTSILWKTTRLPSATETQQNKFEFQSPACCLKSLQFLAFKPGMVMCNIVTSDWRFARKNGSS